MVEAGIEVVDDAEFLEGLPGAIDNFNFKRHPFADGAGERAGDKHGHGIVAAGKATGSDKKRNREGGLKK